MKVARVNSGRLPILTGTGGLGGAAQYGSGGGSVPWSYAQADGGLAGDGTTDDTVAFQAWIDSVTASGTCSGWFFFEPGVYLIGGALQDTGAFNGQILLPDVSTSDEQITLTFQGAARPPYAWHGTTAPLDECYSVIKSTLTGASGTAAVISAGNGTPPAQNNISVVMEDLIFLGPDNPTFTFLNLKNVQGGAIRSIQIATAGGFSGSPVQPTHSNSYGIKLSQVYNSNYTYVDGISVGAYYTGVLQGELAIIRGLVLGVCIVGIELPDSIHASLIVDMHQSGCPTGIKATGLHYCDILQYDAEHYVGNVTPFPTWMNPIYDLDDGSNNMHGHIRFLLIDNDGSGPSGWSVDPTFVKNSGTNVSTAEIGPLSTGASFATPSIALGTAAAAGAASTVIRSDSTIVAFDTTAPVTQAFGDSAATGSAAVASRRDHKHGMPATPPTVSTDTIWDTAGDIAVATGADAAAKVAIGNAGAHLSRINGTVQWDSRTSNPTVATGDRWWRSDQVTEFYYDGTRNVSTVAHEISMPLQTAAPFTGTVAGHRVIIPASLGASEVFLASVRCAYYVDGGTGLNGSNKWVGAVSKNAGATATSIGTITIDSGASSQWLEAADAAINADAGLGSGYVLIDIVWTKTGTPGNLYAAASLTYRTKS